MPIVGLVPLLDSGSFFLGDTFEVHYAVENQRLLLRTRKGPHGDSVFLIGGENEPLTLSSVDAPATIQFENGRPYFRAIDPDGTLTINQQPCSSAPFQLILNDRINLAGMEMEVI